MNGYSTLMRIHENIVSNKIKRQKSNQTEFKGVSKCNNNTKKTKSYSCEYMTVF